MSVKKISYVVALERILNGDTSAEVVERVTALHDALVKRGAKRPEGPTKAQKENMALAENVFSAMEQGVEYTNADIAKLIPELADATPQKVSPLMKMLGERVVTEKVKGKAVYRLA